MKRGPSLAIALLVGVGTVASLASCVAENTPDEFACLTLNSVELRIINLYNEASDDTARSVYLQELGEQASERVEQALATPSLSGELKANIAELQGVFLEPLTQIKETTAITPNSGFEDVEVVGYKLKETFSHADVSHYMATIKVLCD